MRLMYLKKYPNKQKKNFVGVLKVTDEKSRIWSRIHVR